MVRARFVPVAARDEMEGERVRANQKKQRPPLRLISVAQQATTTTTTTSSTPLRFIYEYCIQVPGSNAAALFF